MYTDHRSLALTLTLFTLAHSARRAILFGVSEYPGRVDPKVESSHTLPGPPNDVALMQKTLASKGFTVRALMNSTADEMVGHFDKWLESIKNRDECVFFFSGHGGKSGSTRYLTGTDQKLVGGKYQGMKPLIDFQHKLQTRNPDGIKVFITDTCASPMKNKDGSLKVYEGNIGCIPNRILYEGHRRGLRNTYFFGAKTGSTAGAFLLQLRDSKVYVGYITRACTTVMERATAVNLQTFEKDVRDVLTNELPDWQIDMEGPIREMKAQAKAGGYEFPKELEDALRGHENKDVASRISKLAPVATQTADRVQQRLRSRFAFFRLPDPKGQQKAKLSCQPARPSIQPSGRSPSFT